MPPRPFQAVPTEPGQYIRPKLTPEAKRRRRAKYRHLSQITGKHEVHMTEDERALVIKRMVSAARQRAKVAGVPFSITEAHVKLPTHCPILGIPLFSRKGGGGGGHSPSLDRIIPELGYTPQNIMVISLLANMIKTNAKPEQILRVGQFSVLLRQNLRFAYPGYKLPK